MLPQNLNLFNTDFCENSLSIELILIKNYFILFINLLFAFLINLSNMNCFCDLNETAIYLFFGQTLI
jgi:hypothetical protein